MRAEPFLFVFGAIRVSIASPVVFYAFVFIYEWYYDRIYCFFFGTEAVASGAPERDEGEDLTPQRPQTTVPRLQGLEGSLRY